ncbi:MAG: hypothetical protein ACD_62C00593G0003 [uncultured bacterium]|nr:MAG: hypothetical protein ACD_62C00593G0003 [uncultured bacterium]
MAPIDYYELSLLNLCFEKLLFLLYPKTSCLAISKFVRNRLCHTCYAQADRIRSVGQRYE